METLPIEGINGYCRDIHTHAVINTNNAEYEAYMRQSRIINEAKREAETNKKIIEDMGRDIESLKQMVSHLLKDSNVTSSSSK